MAILNNNALIGASGQGGEDLGQRSVRLNSVDSSYFSRTPASAGNRKTWSFSCWVKRSGLSRNYDEIFGNAGAAAAASTIFFDSNDTLFFQALSSGNTYALVTTQVFRDPSAWYHIVVVADTTNATSTDRLRIYVNGSRISSFSTANYPPQNYDTFINQAGVAHYLGSMFTNTYFNGYLADVYFIDGQALDPTSFGEFDDNGIWQAIEYSGEYGTNGFHLDFADNSSAAALGYDAAGSNDWTVNNLSVTAGAGNDSLVDVPTNGTQTDTGVGGEVRGNYATWLPIYGSTGTFSNGNLDVTTASSNAAAIPTSIFPSSGKWYCEVLIADYAGRSDSLRVGICNTLGVATGLGTNANTWCFLGDGRLFHNNSSSSYGVSVATGDIVNVALDLDAGKIWYGKNGTWMASGSPSTGANPSQSFTANQSMSPAVASGIGSPAYTLNAGQRPFAYAAPSGFKSLNTANLPTPTIADGSTAMDVVTYTGNGSTQTISGLGFSPDFVWIKNRNISGYWHELFDAVRGVSRRLFSNATSAEDFRSGQGLTSFNNDGFSLTYVDANDNGNNSSGNTFVAWAFDAGSSSVTNTAGSISSTVRANPSAGFSIVTFAAQSSGSGTIGHGLGVTPEFVIVKSRDAAYSWIVWHKSLTSAAYSLILNTAAAQSNGIDAWANTLPTSSVLSLGSAYAGAGSSVAYCFAPVAGYSAFGSYVGNGSSTGDGPFVFTGMRPQWIMVKCSSSDQSGNAWWLLYDGKRVGYNSDNKHLGAQASDAEYTANSIDILSNGFKIRDNNTSRNANGATYVYACFAESPFKYARAR